jgi:hypothetical protein
MGELGQRVMPLIDKVHGVTDKVEGIPLSMSKARTYYGQYSYRRRFGAGQPSIPGSHRIRISDGDHQHLTLAHELGHYLDNFLLGDGNYTATSGQVVGWGSKTGAADWQEFLDAAYDTDTWRSMEQHGGSLRSYHRNPLEMFARAYAQWIAHKTGDPVMKAELDVIRAARESHPTSEMGYRQWTDDEFEVISQKLDAIFRNRGLLHEG